MRQCEPYVSSPGLAVYYLMPGFQRSVLPFCRWWTTNQRSGHLCTTAQRNGETATAKRNAGN